tara:strand:+ start:3510 stop:4148 length:639 start_codon:yes stop_codon:yes gene_type:complete
MEKEELDKKDNNIENSENINSSNEEQTNQKENKEEISLEEKVKLLEDKVTRTLAEMENQRRRYEKEKEDAFDYGGFSFAKEALNLLDNLERSKESLLNDESLKNNVALKKITEHLNIIYDDMISIFKKNNIEPIKSIDEKLDPNLHQAMMEVIDDKKENGTIVQEIQKGFLLKDRLLRPSLVAVSKKNSKTEGIDKRDDKKHKENQDKIKEK